MVAEAVDPILGLGASEATGSEVVEGGEECEGEEYPEDVWVCGHG